MNNFLLQTDKNKVIEDAILSGKEEGFEVKYILF